MWDYSPTVNRIYNLLYYGKIIPYYSHMFNDFEDLTKKVIEQRDAKGWTTAQLAKEAGVSRDMLTKWLNSANSEKMRIPMFTNVAAVLVALGIENYINAEVLAATIKETDKIAETEKLGSADKAKIFALVFGAMSQKALEGQDLALDKYGQIGILSKSSEM